MKKLFLLFAVGLLSANLFAATNYDFTYEYEGVLLYYQVVEEGEDGKPGTAMVVPENTVTGNSIYYSSSTSVPNPFGKHVVIPETVYDSNTGSEYTVVAIGPNAFCVTNTENGKYLKSVIIPRTVTHIANKAFYGAFSSQTSSVLNNNISSAITIPENVEQIGSEAFGSSGSESYVKKLDVTWLARKCVVASNAFLSNYGSFSTLGSITFGTMVEEVPANLCRENKNINAVILPYNIRKIGDYAFYRCFNLSRIGMGESVQYIGKLAFNGCNNLNHIICAAPTPPRVEAYAFVDVPIDATMEVPCGKVADYAQAPEWNYFWYFTETILYKASVLVEDDTQGSASVDYDCATATFRAQANEGYKFKEWSNGSKTNPLTVNLTGDITLVALFEADDTPQGLDDIQDKAMPYTKVIEDGQVYLMRGDSRYNLLGIKVE